MSSTPLRNDICQSCRNKIEISRNTTKNVAMLGIFHTLMEFLEIIDKSFGNGNYRDLLIPQTS